MAKDRLFLSSVSRGRDLEPRARASVSQNSRGDILRRSLRDSAPDGWKAPTLRGPVSHGPGRPSAIVNNTCS